MTNAPKKKKTRAKVSELKRSRPTEEWLSWSLVDKMILAVHAAMQHSKKGKYAGPSKLGDVLAEINLFFEKEIEDTFCQADLSEQIHTLLDEYKIFILKAAKEHYSAERQLQVLKKKFGAQNFLIRGRRYLTDGKEIEINGLYKMSNLSALVISNEDLEKVRSNKDTKMLANKEFLYESFQNATGGALPSYRKLNQWRAAEIFGLKRPIDWEDIVRRYKAGKFS